MRDIIISTCIILAIAVFAVTADRVLLPRFADMAGFAARHLVTPVVLVLHGQVWKPAIWL